MADSQTTPEGRDTPVKASRPSVAFAPDQSPSLGYFVTRLKPYKDTIIKLPVILFLIESAIAAALYQNHRSDPFLRFAFQQLLSINFMLMGLAHFSKSYVTKLRALVPDFLPAKTFWIYATGVPMCVGALALCFARTRVFAAKLLIFTLVWVFPANLWCLVSKDARDAMGASMAAAIIRVPFQGTMIVWCMWFLEG